MRASTGHHASSKSWREIALLQQPTRTGAASGAARCKMKLQSRECYQAGGRGRSRGSAHTRRYSTPHSHTRWCTEGTVSDPTLRDQNSRISSSSQQRQRQGGARRSSTEQQEQQGAAAGRRHIRARSGLGCGRQIQSSETRHRADSGSTISCVNTDRARSRSLRKVWCGRAVISQLPARRARAPPAILPPPYNPSRTDRDASAASNARASSHCPSSRLFLRA